MQGEHWSRTRGDHDHDLLFLNLTQLSTLSPIGRFFREEIGHVQHPHRFDSISAICIVYIDEKPHPDRLIAAPHARACAPCVLILFYLEDAEPTVNTFPGLALQLSSRERVLDNDTTTDLDRVNFLESARGGHQTPPFPSPHTPVICAAPFPQLSRE